MANKTFNTRIKNKRDTSANWTSKNPVLLNGELIIVDTASGETRFKIGDGTKKYSQLPFQDEILRNSKVDLDAGVYTATASSTDGIVYTATVPGVDSLTVGASFIMIPNKTSASTTPTLNVNSLGAKTVKRRLSNMSTTLQSGYANTWLSINKPITVVYDGTYWIVEGMPKPVGADIYGTVPQAKADEKGNNIVDTYATIAMLQSMLPKVTTINLVTGWGGTSSLYYQDVTLACCTETSVVDLQPTPTQLASWQDEGLAFSTQSGNGTVRVYVAGGKPSSAISVQVKVQEVTVI